jgi:hypothetical protein
MNNIYTRGYGQDNGWFLPGAPPPTFEDPAPAPAAPAEPTATPETPEDREARIATTLFAMGGVMATGGFIFRKPMVSTAGGVVVGLAAFLFPWSSLKPAWLKKLTG